jgi:hypothetical protein
MIDCSRCHASQCEGYKPYNRSLTIVPVTPPSRVTSTGIKQEPESSAVVVGWKFMERDKASGAHWYPQGIRESQQIAAQED